MGGFALDGVYGRVPCPHCGSTDCMCFGDDYLYCGETRKRVSATALDKSAKEHNMTRYSTTKVGEWELHKFTHIGTGKHAYDFVEEGNVELYNERHGVRGTCPDMKTAKAFVKEHLNNYAAYYRAAS